MKKILAAALILSFASPAFSGNTWPMLRADATGSGASAAVGEPFAANAAQIRQATLDLASPDPAKALRARLTLKRAGADAVDALKAAGDAGKSILENLAKPEILWRLQADEFFTGSPAFDDRAVYAADRGGNLYAADKLTGTQLWRTKLPALSNGTSVPCGGSVFIGCHDGSVVRVKAGDGSIAWTFKADPTATTESWAFVWDSVAVDDKNVYFGTASGKVFAVSIDKGEKVWEFTAAPMTVDGKEQAGRFMSTPALSGGKLFIGSLNGKVYALNAADGTKAWEYAAPAAVSRPVAVGKDGVFLVSDQELIALDPATGGKRWAFKSERRYTSAPTVYGDYVLASGDFGRTYLLKAATGEVVWGANLAGNVDGALEVVSGRIYYNTTDMTLACSNLMSANTIWTFATPKGGPTKAPSPAVDDGILYINTRQTLRTNNPDEMAMSKCLLAVAEPSDNLYGLNANDVEYGLDEVQRRVYARHNKPYALLKDKDGFFQSETLVFNDPSTGAEITRFSDDPSANYHHSSVNRPSYNADGSHLVLHSGRAYNPGRYILRADGTGFRRIDLEPFVLNYGIHPTWDRKRPNICYTLDRTAVYTVDVETFATTKVCGLPDPERGKSIFSYPSADGSLLLLLSGPKVYLVRTDGQGVKTLDLPSPKASELAPKHDRKWEAMGAHDIYFTLNAANTFQFNYGPTAEVGEGIFYEMDTDGNLLRVVYPYKDPDKGSDAIYYSHPAWRQDGKKIAYFGYGGGRRGWGFFLRDADGSNPVKLSEFNVGGHCGWENFDDDWIFASASTGKNDNPLCGTIARYKTDGSLTNEILCRATSGNDNKAYSAIPRVSPSPDGTKAVFTTALLETSAWIDMMSVVAKRPDPPVDVAAAGREITWKAPRLAREIMGYDVYTSADGKTWKLATPEPVRTLRFTAPADGLYAVTSVEWSETESAAVSGTAVVGNAKPVFLLDAEFAEYKLPLREFRDAAAANLLGIEVSTEEAGTATLKFDSPTAGEFTAFARIRGGKWTLGKGTAENADAEWRWVKARAPVSVAKGANTLQLSSAMKGAGVDKVILTTDPAFVPEGTMALDAAAPAAPVAAGKRLDRALIELTWPAAAEPDVRYYNVYYSATVPAVPTQQAFRIASPPKGSTRYIDFAPRPGVCGYYAVTAVDRWGNESAPSRVAVP